MGKQKNNPKIIKKGLKKNQTKKKNGKSPGTGSPS